MGRSIRSAGVRSAVSLSWILAFGLAVLFTTPSAYGQGVAGRMSGTVHDVTGAVIPGASVVLRNDASGSELKTTTDASGFYSISYVPPATYTLRVSSKGFKSYVRTGIVVQAGQIGLSADATLQVGAQVQTVEVKGSIVNLIPKSSGGEVPTIGASEIQNLSTVGRDAMELLWLLPGVVGPTGIPGAGGSVDFTSGSGFQTAGAGINNFNINGLRSDQSMVRLDNENIIDPGNAGGFTVEPNMDMIQEFSVKQSGFEASQGTAGISVEAVTKSGGAKIHGEGYWYLRNAVFNANDWSNNYSQVAKPNSKFNYPGGNIGGPVRLPFTDFNHNNDKMFFFYGIELQRQLKDPGTQLKVMPTEAMRNGDFSGLWTAPNSTCTKNASGVVTGGNFWNMPCIVKDMKTGAATPGNIMPASEVTADGQELLNHTYSLPTPIYNDPTGAHNFVSRPLYPTNRIENTIRIDYNLTENTRAYLRLSQNSDREYYPYGLWWGSGIPRITPDTGHLSGEVATLNVVNVINPTLTNEVQFSMGANNFPWKTLNPSAVASAKLSQDLPGWNWAKSSGGSVFTRTAAVPWIWDGVDNTGSDNWTGSSDTFDTVFGDKTTFELSDNLTKVKGTHTLQFGADFLHTRNDQNSAGVQGRIWSTNWGDGGNTGNLFGNLLAQGITNYDQASNDPDGMWRFWNYEWYAQDSWKVNRKLTLTYGARFAYYPPWYEARGKVATINPNLWTAANDTSFTDGVQVGTGIKAAQAEPYFPPSLAGKFATGLPSSGGFPTPGVWIEPRFAFAYDVFGTGKTVVRAGWGLYAERDQGNTVFGAAQNPPFFFDASSTVSTNITQSGGGYSKIATIDPFGGAASIGSTVYDQTDNHGAQSYEYNFTLDQDIGHQTVLEAAYVGNVGRHLYIENQLGAVPLGALWCPPGQAGCGSQFLASGASGNQNAWRYYKPFGAINILHHVSTSSYNSLQATVRRNVTRGLTLLASYTYSKTLGYSGAFNGTVDPFNSRLNYGLQSYDRPQVLSLSYIYQLPNLGARYFNGNRYAGGVLDGWQISGVTNYQSGSPLSVGMGFGSPTGGNGCVSPDNSKLCSNSSLWTGSNLQWYGTDARALNSQLLFNPQQGVSFNGVNSTWLNTSTAKAPNFNQQGTYENPQFLGPASNDWDATLFKSFALPGEGRRLEFRVAAFDIFNRAQLDNPNTTPQFQWDLPAGATSYSQGQSSGIVNAGNCNKSGYQFGCILDKHGHREMEFAVKLYF